MKFDFDLVALFWGGQILWFRWWLNNGENGFSWMGSALLLKRRRWVDILGGWWTICACCWMMDNLCLWHIYIMSFLTCLRRPKKIHSIGKWYMPVESRFSCTLSLGQSKLWDRTPSSITSLLQRLFCGVDTFRDWWLLTASFDGEFLAL